MKYLILIMALISAFFVSEIYAESLGPDMSDLKIPNQEGQICMKANGKEGCGKDIQEAYTNSCFAYNSVFQLPANTPSRQYISSACESDKLGANILITGKVQCYACSGGWGPEEVVSVQSVSYGNSYELDGYTCPPTGFNEYDIQVLNPDTSENSPKVMCAKEMLPPVDPDEGCSEFGNNSMLPMKSGVGSTGQNACYTNPSTGKSCQFSQGGDNFLATGKTCDGDENDYGDKPPAEPRPDGADDSCYNYGSQGQVLICDVDPNEGCNALLINGETQYQCPAGCGSMDGVYFCTYDDTDNDGVPDDKNQNGVPDKEETCVNGRCTAKPPTDDTGGETPTPTPTPEAPDMTQTNNRLDAIKGELGFIGGKIDSGNKKLDGINSGIQGLKGEQKAGNALLSSISNSNEQIRKNTGFTADSTGQLLDSFNEFKEGIGETEIEGNFDPNQSASFYESDYEDGFEGVWNEKSLAFKQTQTFEFLQQFKFNAGGSPPDTQMCFNLGGSMDFGCAELPTPSPQLLAILKIFILITAAFLCRSLVFGG